MLKPSRLILFSLLVLSVAICPSYSSAQYEVPGRPRVAGSIKLSLLGIGGEVAVPLTDNMDIRAGFNGLGYSRDFDKDGVGYTGQVRFRTIEAHYDWFPFRGSFHLSPGMLVYNGNKVTANAFVPGGQSFDLDDTTYVSDLSNPMTGTGKIDFRKAAPIVTVGWGSLFPRNGHHWSIPVEIGVAFQGAPRAALNFGGGACDATGINCRDINSDPSFQSNVQAEQDKLNKDMSAFKFYPLISIGFGYKF
jgi:hypothetical protein